MRVVFTGIVNIYRLDKGRLNEVMPFHIYSQFLVILFINLIVTIKLIVSGTVKTVSVNLFVLSHLTSPHVSAKKSLGTPHG
jgi:hypothetical protein